jgi:hypothetical protein
MKALAVRPRAFHHSLAVANDSLRDRTFCCPMSQSGRLETLADAAVAYRRVTDPLLPVGNGRFDTTYLWTRALIQGHFLTLLRFNSKHACPKQQFARETRD